VLLQTAFTALLVLAATPFGGVVLRSVLIGSGTCLLATVCSSLWAFRSYHAARPGALLLRLYGAEFVKVMSTLSLFSAAFVMIGDLNLPALLGGYFVVQVLPALFASRPDARPTAEK
jgi:ATP synthase protein I